VPYKWDNLFFRSSLIIHNRKEVIFVNLIELRPRYSVEGIFFYKYFNKIIM